MTDSLRQKLKLNPPRLNEGLFARAYHTRQPVEVSNTTNHPEIKFIPGYTGPELACYPLVIGGRVLALVAFDRLPPDKEARTLLLQFFDRAATALQNARLFEETVRLSQERAALLKIALDFSAALDRNSLQHEVLESFRLALDLDAASLTYIREGAPDLVVGAVIHPANAGQEVLSIGQVLSLEVMPGIETAFRNKIALTLSIQNQTRSILLPVWRQYFLEKGVHSMLVAPLMISDQPMGALLGFAMRPDREFSDNDLPLALGIANQAAVALHRVDLLEKIGKDDLDSYTTTRQQERL